MTDFPTQCHRKRGIFSPEAKFLTCSKNSKRNSEIKEGTNININVNPNKDEESVNEPDEEKKLEQEIPIEYVDKEKINIFQIQNELSKQINEIIEIVTPNANIDKLISEKVEIIFSNGHLEEAEKDKIKNWYWTIQEFIEGLKPMPNFEIDEVESIKSKLESIIEILDEDKFKEKFSAIFTFIKVQNDFIKSRL